MPRPGPTRTIARLELALLVAEREGDPIKVRITEEQLVALFAAAGLEEREARRTVVRAKELLAKKVRQHG
jgi:hypothetical protein